MEIDLNDPNQFTKENVKRLIASGYGFAPTQLRVSRNGIAHLSHIVGFEEVENLSFRLEHWCAKGGYVGKSAASNDEWVERIYSCLRENWPNPRSTHIDTY
jgi:hypothetical protein